MDQGGRRGVSFIRVWPNESQSLLLRAALCAGDDAVAAWRRWKAYAGERGLDDASYRLLPLVYRNLLAADIDEPLLSRMKGVYRRTWYRNQALLHAIADVIRLLDDAGIATIVLKGAALTAAYYRDYGLRMMNDVDVLVPTAARGRALDALDAAGWIPGYFPISALTNERLDVRQSWGFHNGRGREFDLHWHVMASDVRADADDVFWQHAEPLTVSGVATGTLSPTDHLLHICEHGMVPVAVPPVQWIADAVTILQAAGDRVDWERLAGQVKRRRLTLVARAALGYLSREWCAPVPLDWLGDLNTKSVSELERREFEVRVNPSRWIGLYAVDWIRYLRYRLWRDDGDLTRSLLWGFVEYDRRLEGLDRWWQLPWWSLVKLRRLARHLLTGDRRLTE